MSEKQRRNTNLKLIILDLDNTLICCAPHTRYLMPPTAYKAAGIPFHVRPGAVELIEWCHQQCAVAVATTATRRYADDIIASVFPSDSQLLEIRTREDIRTDAGDAGSAANIFRQKRLDDWPWPRDQILAIDDMPIVYGVDAIHVRTVRPWYGQEHDTALLDLLSDLKEKNSSGNVWTPPAGA